MKRGHRNRSASFKPKVALEAIKGLKSSAELASEVELQSAERRRCLGRTRSLSWGDGSTSMRAEQRGTRDARRLREQDCSMKFLRIQNTYKSYQTRLYTSLVKRDFGSFGEGSHVSPPFHCADASDIHVGAFCNIKAGSWIMCVRRYASATYSPHIVIGDGTSIGHRAHIIACLDMCLGQHVTIADGVYISDNLHGFDDISMPIRAQPLTTPGKVTIGDEVWLGEHVCVLPNVTIGRHSAIGSNSVVTKDIPEYSVAVGAPARVVKKYIPGKQTWERV